MPRPTHIAESALYVDDLDRSLRFYTRLLECPVARQDDRFSALRINDSQVLLLFLRGRSIHAFPAADGTIPGHDGTGPLHVCLGIGPDTVDSWEDRLREQGIPVESRVHWPTGATSLYFRDPDFHAVELATPGIWG